MSGVVGMTAPRIQVFRPTMEEFRDFPGYINYMESKGAHKAGLAKVIPPKEWVPRKNGYDDIGHLVIPSPISQMVTGRQGLYQQYNIQKRSMTVKEFQKLANNDNYRTPDHFDYEDLERKYWKNVTYNSPIYGADVSGSLYDIGVKEWNINHLNTILDCVSGDYGIKIDGVNTAYLYFGMWKTAFAWHTEDMDLYSINYLHFGCPKSWYVVPPEHGKRLERLANGFFCSSYKSCPAFLRHKMTIISPPILKQYCIPFDKITQEPGEFMVTFPYGYHAGYNHGFNCAESTNFATERWVEYGKRASQCTCRKDSVKISMDTFVKRYQPDRYDLWLAGKDVGPHPEDPSRCAAAPPPSKCELVLNNRPCKVPDKRRKMMNCVSKRHPITAIHQVRKPKKTKRRSSESSERSEQSLLNKDGDDNVNDLDQDHKQRIRGQNCHLVISKSNDDAKKYTSSLGGLVKWQDDQSPLTITTSIVNQREPALLTPGNQGATVRGSPPSKIRLITLPGHASTMSVYSGQTYKSILLPLKKPARQEGDVSPATLTPATSGDDDTSSVHSDQQKQRKGYGNCDPVFQGAKTDEVKLATEVNSAPTNKLGCVLKDLWSVVTLNRTSPKPISSNSFDQIASTSTSTSTSSEVRYRYPIYPVSASSTKFIKQCMESNGKTNIGEHTHASRLEANNSVVSDKSEPTMSDSDSSWNGNCDVQNLTTSTDLPVMVTAVDQLSSELSPPLLSPASPEESSMASVTISKDSEFLMPSLPREPRCLTPELVGEPFVDDGYDNDANKELTWWSQEALEEWAKPLAKLWQHKLINFDAEMAFNEFCSESEPHCSICYLFAKQQLKGLELAVDGRSQKTRNIPSRSRVLMPEAVFLSASHNESIAPLESRKADGATAATADIGSLSPFSGSITKVDDDGCSSLLVCEDCKVCVHASCYGVLNYDSSLGMRWRCSRCIRQNVNAECCLCVLRGGALKPTTDGRWAHVVCTLVVHDVFFETVPSREPVNISRITLARLVLNCVFCRQIVRRCGRFSGACIQCTAPGETKCASAFHVTCGIAAGVKFEACDWPELIQVSCPKHSDEKNREDLDQPPELAIGQTVISKNRNLRYYHCIVSQKVSKLYYNVDFDATTSCDNLLPQDVESRDCLRDGPPAIDEQISVRWTDNKVYDAIFRGMNTVIKYEVTFEDGSRRIMAPEHIYPADVELLPKRIKSRLSTATPRQHLMEAPIVEEPIALPGTKKYKSRI